MKTEKRVLGRVDQNALDFIGKDVKNSRSQQAKPRNLKVKKRRSPFARQKLGVINSLANPKNLQFKQQISNKENILSAKGTK